jgi:hypothetical protein
MCINYPSLGIATVFSIANNLSTAKMKSTEKLWLLLIASDRVFVASLAPAQTLPLAWRSAAKSIKLVFTHTADVTLHIYLVTAFILLG